jgi:hypothetical protein
MSFQTFYANQHKFKNNRWVLHGPPRLLLEYTSPQESLVDQPPGLVEQGATRMIFEFPHSCMIWHRITPRAAIWEVGSFCFFNNPALHKVATKREWLEFRAAGTRSKFSFDAGFVGRPLRSGEIEATTNPQSNNIDGALMGVREIRQTVE